MANVTVRRNEKELLPTTPHAASWEPIRRVRDLMHWDPFAMLARMPDLDLTHGYWPAFEVKENGSAIVFTADLPGILDQDLELNVTGDRLVVSGKRESQDEAKGDTYYVSERSYGAFTRSFTLPTVVDAQGVVADLKGGVLTITAPKRPEAKARKISIIGEKAKA